MNWMMRISSVNGVFSSKPRLITGGYKYWKFMGKNMEKPLCLCGVIWFI